MKHLNFMILLFSSISPKVIFNFNKNSDISDWIIVDDVVMGGVSSSTFKLNSDGFAVFEGNVSIDNNGGFSSVRYRFPKIKVKEYTSILLKIKGDGKKYQFRLKSKSGEY